MKFFIIFIGFLLSSSLIWADSGEDDFQISSPAFEGSTVIPKKYTCDGENINPPLTFKNTPVNAKSLALTVSDPDAPRGRWSHWVIYNIAPNTEDIAENTTLGTEGTNDFGKDAYGGPCPPPGKIHHYIFQAYALDNILNTNGKSTIDTIEKLIQGHITAQNQLVGTYQRSSP